jgi:hypothetical protein
MRNQCYLTARLLAVASVLLATTFFVSCQQSQTPASNARTAQGPSPANDIFVTFEGPWAIVADPKDANSVLAIAPKTKSHRFLAVVPANTELDAGVYDLSIPAQPATSAPVFDKRIFRTNIDPQAVQRAVASAKSDRYIIRLPKPAEYVVETHYPSHVGNTYPPDPSTEQEYATAVALRYSVTSKTGFQLGTQDQKLAFKPVLLEANTNSMRFTIDPVEVHLTDDPCHTHSREAFRDLTHLLGLTLYVDYSQSPPECHKKDPQQMAAQKAQLQLVLPLHAGYSAGDVGSLQLAEMNPVTLAKQANRMLEAVVYFFHAEGGACTAPIIVSSGS